MEKWGKREEAGRAGTEVGKNRTVLRGDMAQAWLEERTVSSAVLTKGPDQFFYHFSSLSWSLAHTQQSRRIMRDGNTPVLNLLHGSGLA